VWALVAGMAMGCVGPQRDGGAGGSEGEVGEREGDAEARESASRGAAEVSPVQRPPALETAVAARVGEMGADYQIPGPCVHAVCDAGKRLDPGCSACASQVCAVEPSCCSEAWGADCVQYATWFCGLCGGGSCDELPRGSACFGVFAVYCDEGVIEWLDCWEDDAVCAWDEGQGHHGCQPR